MAQQQYDNEMRGVLFRNDRKQTDKHPDMNGSCQIDGVEYWMSGWTKESREGKKFLSLAFKRKDDDGTDQRPKSERKESGGQQGNDDIPFAWLLLPLAALAAAWRASWWA